MVVKNYFKIGSIFVSLFLPLLLSAQTYFPPKTGNWDTLSTNRLGYYNDKIDSLFQYLNATNSKSFILLKDGKIVLEKYFGTFTKDSNWYWASAGKTLTGFCVGIANQEGSLSLNDKSSKYLGAGWTSLSSAQEDSISVLNQITMTTGLKDNVSDPDCTLPSCLQFAANAGSRWAYHNAPYTLLDKVLESSTGVNLNTFVYLKVANPIGMKGLYFKSGYNNVYGSDSRSMARFGLLLLNKGVWNGSAILKDSNYFKSMTNSSQQINKSYGYLTWLNGKTSYMAPQSQFVFPGSISPDAPNDVFMALGKNGQLINVCPSKRLVWIRMGNPPGDNGLVPWMYNNEIWKKINQLICNSSEVVNLEQLKITISPNPVIRGNTVKIKSDGKLEISIINSTGQKVNAAIKKVGNEFHLETQNLPLGIYFLCQQGGSGAVKIVIQ